jgi:hypothetical protein
MLERARDLIVARLPRGWRFDRLPDPAVNRPDGVFSVSAPDGTSVRVLVEVKRNVEARDVASLANQLDLLAEELDLRPAMRMIVARYLSGAVRERLVASGLAYADATGNLYLSTEEPSLFLRDAGTDRDPWRGPGRPRDSFRGPIAAKVVRALADFAPPMTVLELIERSEVSTGAAYRVVEFLERQDLLERRPRGPIERVDWRRTIELWSRDYALNLEDRDSSWLAPRGIEPAIEGLGGVEDLVYAVTGSVAAAYFEEYARPRLLMVYTDEPSKLADLLDIRPTEGGANVLLIRPADSIVYARSELRGSLVVAAPSQLAGDLLNGPGRAPSEAEALLDWMERNESVWRR